MVYLDNNATTKIPKSVINIVTEWFNKGNPSSLYQSAQECQDMMQKLRNLIAVHCQFSRNNYSIIFNSGASESNSHILLSSVIAYKAKTKIKPTVIIGSTEHPSIKKCCAMMAKYELCYVKELSIDTTGEFMGNVNPTKLQYAITSSTCIVSIMAANNETGIINPIGLYADICHSKHVPYHSDLVQILGKKNVNISALNIDAFSISFHKIHGPQGVGALVIKNSFLKGYDLCAMISGGQNNGMRGGTENVTGLAGSLEGMLYTLKNMSTGVENMQIQRHRLITEINKKVKNCYYIETLLTDPNCDSIISRLTHIKKIGIFWISSKNELKQLPNTILFAILAPNFKTKDFITYLCSKNIYVGTGSACSSKLDRPSDTVLSHHVPPPLCDNIIRISTGYETTSADIDTFVNALDGYLFGNI